MRLANLADDFPKFGSGGKLKQLLLRGFFLSSVCPGFSPMRPSFIAISNTRRRYAMQELTTVTSYPSRKSWRDGECTWALCFQTDFATGGSLRLLWAHIRMPEATARFAEEWFEAGAGIPCLESASRESEATCAA